jgi:hypothetical protein
VIDQKILLGQRKGVEICLGSHGRGIARTYTPFEAFGIACAAAMIGAGLRRKTVRNCFDLICSYIVPKSRNVRDVPLFQAFQKREVAMLEIGDHLNVRIYGSEDYRKKKLRFGWRQIETGTTLTDYEPLVVVGINVAKIRKFIE